jgi:PIN domain nuclease of toxin-antitoxin system
MIFLDTHVVVWLYAGERTRLPAAVAERIEAEDLLLSPIVPMELQFLREIGRLRAEPCRMLDVLRETIGAQVDNTPFFSVVLQAMELKWTCDPFDRLIVAQALLRHAPLLTRDDQIRKHFAGAVWD